MVCEEKTFEAYSLYESMKNKLPLGGAIFDPRAVIWTILVGQDKATYQISEAQAF